MIDDNNIEKLFQEGLGGMSEMPPASVKSNIDKAIGFKSGGAYWMYAVGTVLVLFLGLFIYKCSSKESAIYHSKDLMALSTKSDETVKSSGEPISQEIEQEPESPSSFNPEKDFANESSAEELNSTGDNSVNSLNSGKISSYSKKENQESKQKSNSNSIERNKKPKIISKSEDSAGKGLETINNDQNSGSKNSVDSNLLMQNTKVVDSNSRTISANENGILDGKPLNPLDSTKMADESNNQQESDTIQELVSIENSDSISVDSILEVENVMVPNLPEPLRRLKYIGLSAGPIFPNSSEDVNSRTGFAAELYYQQSVFNNFYASGGIGYSQNSRLIQKTMSDTSYIDTSYVVYVYDSNQQVMDSMVVNDTSQLITSSQLEEMSKTQQFTIPINLGWMHNLNSRWAVLVNLGARPTFNSYRNNDSKSELGLNKFSLDLTLQPSIIYKLNRFEFLAGPGFGYSAISRWKDDSPFYKPKEIYWNVRAGVRLRL